MPATVLTGSQALNGRRPTDVFFILALVDVVSIFGEFKYDAGGRGNNWRAENILPLSLTEFSSGVGIPEYL